MSRGDQTVKTSGVRDGTILAVCTENVCCSPYIERVLRSELVGTDIVVSSAGTHALVGSAIDGPVAERLAAVGADPTAFSARELSADLVAGADLVLCASRAHRSAVVRLSPVALRRTYAMADFSDLAARVAAGDAPDPGGSESGRSFVRQISETAERARGRDQARTTADAAIVDPYGQRQKIFDKMFAQVDGLLAPIVAALTGRPASYGRPAHPRRRA